MKQVIFPDNDEREVVKISEINNNSKIGILYPTGARSIVVRTDGATFTHLFYGNNDLSECRQDYTVNDLVVKTREGFADIKVFSFENKNQLFAWFCNNG